MHPRGTYGSSKFGSAVRKRVSLYKADINTNTNSSPFV